MLDPSRPGRRFNIPEPALAAQQFNWLAQSIPLDQAMLDPERRFGRAELDRHSAAAVCTFLAAYRPH